MVRVNIHHLLAGVVEDPDPRTTDGHGERTRHVTLSLTAEEEWTLHHVLLDRIDAGSTPTGTPRGEPPSLEVLRAFERLDAGETTFTVVQLEAVRSVLAEYHHASTWWAVERSRIEQLLHRVSAPLEARRSRGTHR